MKIITIFLILIITLPLFATEDTKFSISTYPEHAIKFAFPNASPPYAWTDGEAKDVQGIIIDIVHEAANRMNMPISVAGYPWVRANSLVKEGVVDALITYGPSRTEWAVYGEEVVLSINQVLLTSAQNPKLEQLRKVKTIEDLRQFKLVDERGSEWVKKNLIDKGFQVNQVSNFDQVHLMLTKGRADANISNPVIAKTFMKKLALEGQLIELTTFHSLPFHLVIGKHSLYTKIIPEFNQVIRDMKEDGTIQSIFDKY